MHGMLLPGAPHPRVTSVQQMLSHLSIAGLLGACYTADDTLERGERKRRCRVAEATIEERQLLKSLHWWDGFVIALCNPGFLIASLGFSLATVGALGSMILWGISATVGSLQNWIYTETATMFPDKPGGSRCTRTRGGGVASTCSARSPRSAIGSAGRSCCRCSAT